MGAPDRIILGSRGSDLALAQARMVEQALRKAWPNLEVALEIIRTSGDEGSRSGPVVDRKAGRKGLFTREIEKELFVRRIDLAVHSAKDLPSEAVEGLELRATLPRAHPEDILITRNGAGLTSVPEGATIATGSIRRQRQLQWKRPDLEVADLRGNVPTRLRKLQDNKSWSGIILARAGLERLGMEIVGRVLRLPRTESDPGPPASGELPYNVETLPADDFLAAGGQGVIALQARGDDDRTQRLVAAVNDRATFICLRAEREFLRLLNGDCDSPVGVQARLEGDELRIRAQIFEREGAAPRRATVMGRSGDPEALAAELMEEIYGG